MLHIDAIENQNKYWDIRILCFKYTYLALLYYIFVLYPRVDYSARLCTFVVNKENYKQNQLIVCLLNEPKNLKGFL